LSGAYWRIRYAPQARRDLHRLDPPIGKRVIGGIERLAGDDARADVRKIAGSNELRLRVGDWRVRFKRDAAKHEIVVLRVLPRGKVYKR